MKPGKNLVFIFFLTFFSFGGSPLQGLGQQVLTGAEQSSRYFPLLEGKRVGVVGNQTSILPQSASIHLVDFLLEKKVEVVKVFVPEHGFRGTADAGEKIANSTDPKTGLPIVSLYGNNKKPTAEQLQDLDVVIFDLQDVGVRFFTYISTLHYVMEACAEQGKKLILLDRPNPNGSYLDGPILKKGYESFVGMHPIPIVHGLTTGELAQMINEEGWLGADLQVELTVIPVAHWTHDQPYDLPVKPSPNLPNAQAIQWYPSTCLFEGTVVSLGRGTLYPFQVYGYPDPRFGAFTFTPVSIEGMSKTPPHQNQKCYGRDLREINPVPSFTLAYLMDAYQRSGMKDKFFNNYFNTLVGTDELKKQILEGKTEEEIRATWQEGLQEYSLLRDKYLLYPKTLDSPHPNFLP